MITSEDIKFIVESGEGYNAEFKISVPKKVKEISEEICAFANSAGGVLLIGVNDDNQIKGVSIDNRKRAAIQNSLGEITPALHCHLHIVEVDGKSIGVIEVSSGQDKPYVLSGAIYVRLGSVSQKLTTAEQMRDFFQQSGKIYFDEAECNKFDYHSEVDNNIMTEFKANVPISKNITDNQIFKNLKLLTSKEKFKNGSVLFFGKEPDKYFEKAVLRCVAFDGITKRYIVDDKIYGGPLLTQYSEAVYWLKKKLDVRYEIESQGTGARLEHWEIPENVFKEAIINSLCHRDYYEKGSTIIIELFDDRVEITNPGGLISAISKEEFGTKSYSRNPLIFGLFTRMHLVEQVGSGIMRMRDMMLKAGLSEPEYKTEGLFTIIMTRPLKSSLNKYEKVGANEEISEEYGVFTGYLRGIYGVDAEDIIKRYGMRLIVILEKIHNNPNITKVKISNDLGTSLSTIEKDLKKLKDTGIIERIGSDKTGKWIIIKRNTVE